MASSNTNLFLILGAVGIGYFLFKPTKRTLTLTIKTVPSKTPSDVKPAPKPDKTPVPIPEEYTNLDQVELFEGQYALQLPSQPFANDETAPLIILIPPNYITATSTSLSAENHKTIGSFPKNLPARVFLLISGKPYSSTESAASVGKVLLSGLKKLQSLYPTNKIILFGFGHGILPSMYLAGSNAVDATYSYGDYGNYNYDVQYPGATSLYGWLPANAVGDEWFKISEPIYVLNKAFLNFKSANYPSPSFLKGSGEQSINPGEIDLAAKKMISQQLYIPYQTDPGFVVEYDGNLDECAIIVKPEKLGLATWSLTTTAVGTARLMDHKVTVKDFWDIIDGFFNMINSKCTLKERYWDDAPDAMFGYLAIRSGIRALMNRGLMDPNDADIVLTQARDEAIENGVVDDVKFLPGLKNEFEY